MNNKEEKEDEDKQKPVGYIAEETTTTTTITRSHTHIEPLSPFSPHFIWNWEETTAT